MKKLYFPTELEYCQWRESNRLACLEGSWYELIGDKAPTNYPCICITCDGEDSGMWTAYDFVYPEDFIK